MPITRAFPPPSPAHLPHWLEQQANSLRISSLTIVHHAGIGHPGGDLSSADILTTLYLAVLNLDPANPDWPNRDRFIMSKVRMDPLPQKFRSFGFATEEIDGHNHAALLQRFKTLPIEPGKPTCIIANTIKGKGVSFAQNKPEWHHGVPSDEQLAAAIRELEEAIR